MSGKIYTDIRVFYIASTHHHLDRISKGIEKFLPNLLGFLWYDGNLATLTADDLMPFPELQMFGIYGNKLVSLDADVFKHTPKLELLYVTFNLLEHVGFGLLDGLNYLSHAYFQGNPCITFGAETPEAIQELKIKLQN